MIENKVSALHQKAIHGAVAVAGGFAWADNTRERSNGLLRILPVDRQNITADTLWPAYRLELELGGWSTRSTPSSPRASARAVT